MKTRTFKMTMMAVALSALVACFLMLTACGSTNVATNTMFAFETDANGIHVVAQNGADGSDSETITVEAGQGLSIEPTVNKGAFHVTVTDSTGKALFDEEITDNTAQVVSVAGDVEVEVEAIAADGTLTISAGSVVASASAEAASSAAAR